MRDLPGFSQPHEYISALRFVPRHRIVGREVGELVAVSLVDSNSPAQVFTDLQMNKKDIVYVHDGLLLSHKKQWNLDICTDLGGGRVV